MSFGDENQLPDARVARRRGRALREAVPRASLGALADRPDSADPLALLAAQSADRVSDLVPLRYERMSESPFSFLRGSALLQAVDLALGASSGLEVQLCGDAHLANFGIFSSPERHLVFDVNDFDETARGPFEWDVKRLASSIAVAGEHLDHLVRHQEAAVSAAVSSYRLSMRDFARLGPLATWYSELDLDAVLSDLDGFFTDEQAVQVQSVMRLAKGKGQTAAYAKVVHLIDGRPRIVDSPPLQVPIDQLGGADDVEQLESMLTEILAGYVRTLPSDRRDLLAQFTPVDAARKVVGVGSVGTRCFAILLLGRDVSDPFLLQIKEATASVIDVARQVASSLEPGERVVRGQQLLQATPDLFLGWHGLDVPHDKRRSFYVRQLYDNKASIDVERLGPNTLASYARACGWTLARAHARGGRAGEIAGYVGKSSEFDDAIGDFALSYRQRNRADYEELKRALSEGRSLTSV